MALGVFIDRTDRSTIKVLIELLFALYPLHNRSLALSENITRANKRCQHARVFDSTSSKISSSPAAYGCCLAERGSRRYVR